MTSVYYLFILCSGTTFCSLKLHDASVWIIWYCYFELSFIYCFDFTFHEVGCNFRKLINSVGNFLFIFIIFFFSLVNKCKHLLVNKNNCTDYNPYCLQYVLFDSKQKTDSQLKEVAWLVHMNQHDLLCA